MKDITNNGHALFLTHRPSRSTISLQYNGHQDLKILATTTKNALTLHITSVCYHIDYTYGIDLECYQEEMQIEHCEGVVK